MSETEIKTGMLDCGCPSEYPRWDGEDVDMGAWLMHEQGAPMFLHMPIGYESYLDRQHKDIKRLHLTERWPGFVLTQSAALRGRILCPLSEDTSPARHTLRLSNPFHVRSKLVRGDVGSIKNEVRVMQSSLLDEWRMPKELFLCYLTCPRCQEERGGIQILLLRHWVPSPTLKARLARQASA
ncbi:MAG: hypothetical protein Q9M30_10135 [Mariprofundaceae bacterium]|nr:hypothetical protein [Mariprofundaceae bacterium]